MKQTWAQFIQHGFGQVWQDRPCGADFRSVPKGCQISCQIFCQIFCQISCQISCSKGMPFDLSNFSPIFFTIDTQQEKNAKNLPENLTGKGIPLEQEI